MVACSASRNVAGRSSIAAGAGRHAASTPSVQRQHRERVARRPTGRRLPSAPNACDTELAFALNPDFVPYVVARFIARLIDGVDRHDAEIAGPPILPKHAIGADCFRTRIHGVGHACRSVLGRCKSEVCYDAVLSVVLVDEDERRVIVGECLGWVPAWIGKNRDRFLIK